MSFGRPGSSDFFKVTPPARGSFPLDHDGDCKTFMLSYMNCLKTNKNDGSKCRPEAKDYLECRMDNGLMDRENMDNLGFRGVHSRNRDAAPSSAKGGAAGVPPSSSDGTKP